MKYVRLTLRPVDARLPPVADLFYELDAVETAEGLQWNVSGEPTTLMSRAEGDLDALTAALEDHERILEYDLTRVGERECYLFTRCERTRVSDDLFDAYTDSGLIVVPPTEYDSEGMHMRVVGDPATLGRVAEETPAGIAATVDSIGEFADARESILAGLSDRQREAVETGLDVGYYDVPRETTHEAVARRMGVAPSTACEHLRKAESRILHGVLKGRDGREREPPSGRHE